jgi:hypothetical protein
MDSACFLLLSNTKYAIHYNIIHIVVWYRSRLFSLGLSVSVIGGKLKLGDDGKKIKLIQILSISVVAYFGSPVSTNSRAGAS